MARRAGPGGSRPPGGGPAGGGRGRGRGASPPNGPPELPPRPGRPGGRDEASDDGEPDADDLADLDLSSSDELFVVESIDGDDGGGAEASVDPEDDHAEVDDDEVEVDLERELDGPREGRGDLDGVVASEDALDLGSFDPGTAPEDLLVSRTDPVPEDLSESTAYVLMSRSDVQRLEPADVGGSASDADLAVSRADPVPQDLSESTALVVLSDSDARRLDTSGVAPPLPGGAIDPSGAKAGRGPKARAETARGDAARGGGERKGKGKGKPKGGSPAAGGGGGRGTAGAASGGDRQAPPSRLAWLVAGGVAALGLASATGIYALSSARVERERTRHQQELARAVERERRSEGDLAGALDAERRRHEQELASLRLALAAAEARAAESAAALASAREAARRDKQQAVRDFEEALGRERQRAVSEADTRARLRAARERADLEARARDTVGRYEALLAQAEETSNRALDVIEREARAEIDRRQALFDNELEARIARLEAEKQEAVRLEAERVEERLRLELAPSFGGGSGDGLLGGGSDDGGGLEEGIDLEKEVWEHLTGHLTGSAEYRMFAYWQTSSAENANSVRNEGVFRLSYDVDPTDWLTLKVAPRVIVDDERLSQGSQTDLVDDRERRPIFTLEEAYASATFGELDIRLGKVVLALGSADLFNPTDVLNPVDFSDLLDTRKIGIPALEAAYYLMDGEIKLQALWAPFFTPTRFAPAGERFTPLRPDLPVPIADRELPPGTLDAGMGMLRLETTLFDVDLALTALTQINPVPNLEARIDLSIPGLTLVPVYDRRYMIGIDASTVLLDEWILNLELAQFLTDGDGDDDYLLFVAGVRRDFYPFDKRLTAILEYVGEWVQRKASDEAIVRSPFQRIFANALLTRLTLTPIEHLDIQLTGAVLFDGPESFYIQPEVRYAFGNHTRVTAGFDLFGGPKSTFFGGLFEDRRFYMMLRLAF